MDKIDHQILQELSQNSRISYAELGRKFELTRVSIRDRIQKLMDKGIIEAFTVIVNPEKVGKSISAFFEVDVEPYHLEEVANHLAQNEQIENIYHMTGSTTLHMHALLKDNNELERFLINTLYSKKEIKRIESHIILKRYKSRKGGERL